jgi:hypothetical protein
MKHKSVVTHTIPQTDLSSLIDSSVTNTLPAKLLCKKKIASPHVLAETQQA